MKNTPFSASASMKALDEFAADFVGVLADQRADGGDDAAAVGAEFFHRVDGGFQHAGQRALPAGMRRADHARGRHRRTGSGPQSAAVTPMAMPSVRVTMASARGCVALPWSGRHHDVGRMDLVQR